jgi:hypothetical protein
MKSTVQARLSVDEKRSLDHLVHALGWSPSRIVREGLRLMAAMHLPIPCLQIAGVGQFSSGRSDLGSNKKYLKGFGH